MSMQEELLSPDILCRGRIVEDGAIVDVDVQILV
jgi:hypothetical protein